MESRCNELARYLRSDRMCLEVLLAPSTTWSSTRLLVAMHSQGCPCACVVRIVCHLASCADQQPARKGGSWNLTVAAWKASVHSSSIGVKPRDCWPAIVGTSSCASLEPKHTTPGGEDLGSWPHVKFKRVLSMTRGACDNYGFRCLAGKIAF